MNCNDCCYNLPRDGYSYCTYDDGECIKISMLEKENAELEDKLANADYQLEGRDLEIKELEKENAELKKLKRECETSLCRAEYQYNYEQLTKAKVFLEQLVSEITVGELEVDPNILLQAENFLKEE